MRFRPRYVRDRLTLWYVGVFGIVLLTYIGGAVAMFVWQLSSQMYHAAVQDIETVEGLLYFTPDGRLLLHEEYHNHPENRLLQDRLMEVLTPGGQVLFRNEKLHGRDFGGKPFRGEGESGYYERSVRLSDGTRVLAISHIHAIGQQPLLIRLGYSTEPLTLRVTEFVGLLLLALPVALVVAAFAGYRVAGKALSPLEEMASQTERITASQLNERVPVENPDDELGHMALVLNGLLERLQASFEQIRRFTSDVSHELRTPLASIRSVGEVGLQMDHSSEGYRDIIGSMLEEVGRLTHLVDTLLTISRADAGQLALHPATLSLDALVREAIGIVAVLAEEKHQTISLAGGESVLVHADSTLLRQAILNLLDNAVKYSPVGSEIRVSLIRPLAGWVELRIEDQGPGIPEADRARIFDRFYRVEEARSRESGGIGLGLAIARWAVEANEGEIGVRPAGAGGSEFYLRMPVAE